MKIAHTKLLACTTLLFLATSGQAWAVVATASLDWSSVQISALAIPGFGTPTLSVSQQQTSWNSSANASFSTSDSHSHSTSDWTTSVDILSDTPAGRGDAMASATAFSTSASADSPSGSSFAQNSGNGGLSRTANVQVSGPAAVVISVPYSLAVSALPFSSEFAVASVSGTLSGFTNSGIYNSSSSSFSLYSYYFSPPSQSGTLLFGLVVDGPSLLNLSFSAGSSASTFAGSIPEASTAWTLLAGLAMTGVMLGRRALR